MHIALYKLEVKNHSIEKRVKLTINRGLIQTSTGHPNFPSHLPSHENKKAHNQLLIN